MPIKPSVHEIPSRVFEKFYKNVSVAGPDDCWLWKLSTGSHGYGQVGWGVGGRVNAGTTAHRVAWIITNGPIPHNMTVDHLCRNRPCVNPKHLRLLTNEENAFDNGAHRKTHCPRGHEYSGTNLYVTKDGHRRCRACARIVKAEWELKRVAP